MKSYAPQVKTAGSNMHIDDWLDSPALDDSEKWAKEFLDHCRRPAINKDYTWLAANPLFCSYKGWRRLRYWASAACAAVLSPAFSASRVNGYDIRPDVGQCSEWSKAPNAQHEYEHHA